PHAGRIRRLRRPARRRLQPAAPSAAAGAGPEPHPSKPGIVRAAGTRGRASLPASLLWPGETPLMSMINLLLALVLTQDPTESFEKLHQMVRPAEQEAPWTEIPWMTSLWQARERAARE